MSAAAKLEALLARVQHNRAQPRVALARALSAVQPAAPNAALPAAPSPAQLSPTPTPSPAPVSPARAPAQLSPTSTPSPSPAPQSPVVTTPTPAPRSPIELPPAALVGMVAAPRIAELGADAATPPRGLRTPVPPAAAQASSTPTPAPEALLRTRQPTPLELAMVDEAEHTGAAPAAATPAAPRAIAASAQLPPSKPIVQIVSEPDAAEPATFGGLLQRTLALRPR